MSFTTVPAGIIDYRTFSDIGDFIVDVSPIEGRFHRSRYSSAIGFFCIGKSPIGLPPFVPGNAFKRVIFSLPKYVDSFALKADASDFVLPPPEGWSS